MLFMMNYMGFAQVAYVRHNCLLLCITFANNLNNQKQTDAI